ncbi:hypothetical protein DAPPUDRAFT_110356 [Daphnia pulex]|uniref:K Homology domain-containing protein n=2 Tax=Daphnia pulex TaxID=6669 RepID=E9H629_DAPPU|nr:hypothetical protein DAPPUDRAFT_110356 [Daphnia pulex]|eukprot:EFX72828.1 hypothetical protein DAPPUDRAFT_110356 [Daphnia pulex]
MSTEWACVHVDFVDEGEPVVARSEMSRCGVHGPVLVVVRLSAACPQNRFYYENNNLVCNGFLSVNCPNDCLLAHMQAVPPQYRRESEWRESRAKVTMRSFFEIAGLAIGAGALAAVGVLAMRKWVGVRRPSETKEEIGTKIPSVQPRILALEYPQTPNVTELFAASAQGSVSTQAGLGMSEPIPKIRQALTDGRYQERKEDLMSILWLQNRLVQVEFERDWIVAEKASLEEMVEEKAQTVMNYVSQLLQENEAMSGYLQSETERADRAESRAEEETALRMQDRVNCRRMWAEHQEILYELKSTRIELEENKTMIVDLQSELARERRKKSIQETEMEPVEETTNEADQVPVELYECHYEVQHPVVEQELADKFVLENIALTHFGRVIGNQGRRVKELENTFKGLKMKVWTPNNGLGGSVTVCFTGSDFESRREAARCLIEDLPIEVVVRFCGASLSSDLMQKGFTYRARDRVQVTDVRNGWYRLSGRPLACQQYFDYVLSVLAAVH